MENDLVLTPDELQRRQEARENSRCRNTHFSCKVADAHRRKNQMSRIKVNEVWLTEEPINLLVDAGD